jgi:hypothetical protein
LGGRALQETADSMHSSRLLSQATLQNSMMDRRPCVFKAATRLLVPDVVAFLAVSVVVLQLLLLPTTYAAYNMLQPPEAADTAAALQLHRTAAVDDTAVNTAVTTFGTGICTTFCPVLAGCFSCPRLVTQGCSKCKTPNYSLIGGQGCGTYMKCS